MGEEYGDSGKRDHAWPSHDRVEARVAGSRRFADRDVMSLLEKSSGYDHAHCRDENCVSEIQDLLRMIDAFAVDGISASYDGAGRQTIPQLWEKLAQTIGTTRSPARSTLVSPNPMKQSWAAFSAIWPGFVLRGEPLLDGIERRPIAGGPYLVFDVHGGARMIPAAYDFIYATWLPGSRKTLRGHPSFTCESDLDAKGWPQRVEIWIAVEAA